NDFIANKNTPDQIKKLTKKAAGKLLDYFNYKNWIDQKFDPAKLNTMLAQAAEAKKKSHPLAALLLWSGAGTLSPSPKHEQIEQLAKPVVEGAKNEMGCHIGAATKKEGGVNSDNFYSDEIFKILSQDAPLLSLGGENAKCQILTKFLKDFGSGSNSGMQ